MLTVYINRNILNNMNEAKYIHEQHTVHHILYHIIFCPKRRRKILVGPVHDRLKQIIEQVASENSWRIVELAIQPDHVHLFIQANPYTLPTDIARLIKGRSAHDLREEFDTLAKMPSLWTRAYQAVNRVCVGKARRVRFKSKGRGIDRVEGKRNVGGMRFVLDANAGDGGFLIWNKQVIPAIIDWQSEEHTSELHSHS